MRTRALLTTLTLCAPLVACSSGAGWRLEEGLAAERIEIQVDGDGATREIEYHVLPSAVPQAVHASMDRLHPGGSSTAGEKEYEGSTLYWELTKTVGGYKVEAMFLPDGTLHSEEVEVAASSVPGPVRSAVDVERWGQVRAWEEIRDGDRALVEYHAKTTRGGKSYKLLVSPGGEVLAVYREVQAEIELPVE